MSGIKSRAIFNIMRDLENSQNGGKKEIPINKKNLSEQLHSTQSSVLQRYCQKAVGSGSLLFLCKYELITTLLHSLSGALGYGLRKFFYPCLFRCCGRGVILGKCLTIRHPGKISIGENVAIDDNVMLDASGADNTEITIGDGTVISRNCTIQGKTGPVFIGKRADIGCDVVFSSIAGITLGDSVLIAGKCYLGGGRYNSSRLDIPIMDQGGYSRGPLHIGAGTWLGAGVTVLDGVRIGKDCIVGAGSVVTHNLPDYAVALGVPAKVHHIRGDSETSGKG